MTAKSSMYTMMETCRLTGLSYQTLKYYCNEGLVPDVQRDANNRRIFSEHMVKWIKDLNCLKKCGMSIEEMKEYLAMCLEGQASIPRRQAMLVVKKQKLQEAMAELKASMDYIDKKQKFYDDVQTGKIPYVSNLLPEYRKK